jgi:hypothetical protein
MTAGRPACWIENPDRPAAPFAVVLEAHDFVPGGPGARYPWGPEAGSAVAFDLAATLLSAGEQQAVAGFLRQLAEEAIRAP